MLTSEAPRSGIQLNRSVHRAALLLKELATHRQGLTLTELSCASALPESTVYRLLATLQREGFVERAGDGSGRFQMGLEMFRLGSAVLDRLGIGQQVLTYLEQLAAETGETVNLGTLHGFHVLYLQKVESKRSLRASLTVGSASVPAHCSANGKMLLSQLEDETVLSLLDSHRLDAQGPNSIVDREALMVELHSIRIHGYAVDDLEFAADIRAVAAPIRNHLGTTIAAVAVAAPATRMSLERAHTLAPTVVKVAGDISKRLGHHW
jgi:DNA-binding IclR family transcriptional regulator